MNPDAPISRRTPEKSPAKQPKQAQPSSFANKALKFFGWLLALLVAAAIAGAAVVAVGLAMAYPNLPDVSELADYRPKLPMRVYSSEGALLGEFGEERRNLTPINEIPKVMVDAVLAIEDTRFFEHSGVDYKGMARALLANLGREKAQGASTITMQVARNVYLSSEKTYTRKIYEILLTLKLEHALSKNQILEIYMNQIYLGNRAYGFSAASETYFGKPLKDVTVAEAAMLAGLPKAPSAYNPISNPKRARIRQLYIIDRMEENRFITPAQASQAREEPLKIRSSYADNRVHAEYVAEMARQLIFAQYGSEAYTRGLNVYTTLIASDQETAYDALRKGIMDYEKRQHYRGPEKFISLPAAGQERDEAIDEVLAQHPDNGNILSAVVLEASARKVVVIRADGDPISISGDGLKPVQSGLSDKAPPNTKLRPGAVVRIMETAKKTWELTQLPEVEGAFVSLDPRSGAIKALVGGFDFDKNKFNHVTQAWRQPGSSFKPFIYSAALEKGFSPTTVINDAPLSFPGSAGQQPWEPKNSDGRFDGPMTMRQALARSKNLVTIRVMQSVGPKKAQEWVTKFGFDADKQPPYLPMALGAGSVTPMQMVAGYSVFANGGHRVNPYLIAKITDHRGNVLSEFTPPSVEDLPRAIDARNAFIMDSLLQDVARYGTAAKAQAQLKRPDIYGKTGTTNDSVDAWFAGFQPTNAAVVWMGYDNPRSLGAREYGGGLSLPIWINYMQHALKGVPVAQMTPPSGLVNQGGDWYYEEYARSAPNLGLDSPASTAGTMVPPPNAEERNKILDLFRN
ncbi:penicillin-binding protein 1A [Comamonas sp. BIGb0152]|uniref:penicillin-binding protein 1A n=1 Tax=Comamonas sp. BIGb0152 TaxID=2940601 RepID=UPI00216A297F|nr:penicillin-binding protein 1A [Comamonas sp. BIGb0152]MCS4292367.1 penicillin-binding protein 1A [Comamonas sp. BIGb0152]